MAELVNQSMGDSDVLKQQRVTRTIRNTPSKVAEK